MIHFFVHRPVATFMLYAAVILLGMVSLSRLRVSLFPDISFPRLTVLTIYSGAAPDEIETLVTRPIEEAVSGVNGVKKLRSRSEEGL
ncbi:MAG: efflux RND transporter permease subunit, partial [Spirochaetia bacterium]|nr:efflux RND transporter permease subunit [Spirochaetia bacterium]